MTALTEKVPDHIAADGTENVDYYRRLRADGATAVEAQALLKLPELQTAISMQQVWNNAVKFYGAQDKVPPEIKVAIANGISFDFAKGRPMVRSSGCDTQSFGCEYEFIMQKDKPNGQRTLEEYASFTVAEAAEKIEELLPEFYELQAAYRNGRATAETAALYRINEAKLQSAYIAYILYQDETDAPPLLDFASDLRGGEHPRNLWLMDEAARSVDYRNKETDPRGIADSDVLSPTDFIGPGAIKVGSAGATAVYKVLAEGFASLGKEAAHKLSLQVVTQMSKPGWTGTVGETALLQMYGGGAKSFKTDLGWRYVDNLADDIAREAKTGYASFTPFIQKQIEKDAWLKAEGLVAKVEWQFFRSPATGKVGADPRVLQMLSDRGIGYVIH